MARHRDVKVGDKWILYRITPNWEKLTFLSNEVDNGNYSALDELVDLAIYEEETELYQSYIDLAAKRGNFKAKCVQARKLNDWDIKKLITYHKGYKQGIVSEYDYKQVRDGFLLMCFVSLFTIVVICTLCKMLNVL